MEWRCILQTVDFKRIWTKPNPKHNVPTKWNWVVSYPENLQLGKYVDIGAFTYLQAQKRIVISDNVEIGSHCSIYSVNTIDGTSGIVFIMEGAQIGSHSTILPGVTIGKNSKVGAHSLVNKNVLDNTIVVGVPAKKIGENSHV